MVYNRKPCFCETPVFWYGTVLANAYSLLKLFTGLATPALMA